MLLTMSGLWDDKNVSKEYFKNNFSSIVIDQLGNIIADKLTIFDDGLTINDSCLTVTTKVDTFILRI